MTDSSSTSLGLAIGAGVAAASLFALGYYRGRFTAPGMCVGGSAFSSINRPTAGARFEQVLPRGTHKLQLYSLATPNGQKVTVLLEELGVPYDAHLINIGSGEQFGSGFVELNPNSKIPALLDADAPGGGEQRVFESGAIMLYLVEKYRSELLPSDPKLRTECLSWLFFNIGAAPFFGQFGHFSCYAPGAKAGDVMPYARDRYKTETQRLCAVLEGQLSDGRPYLLTELTVADLAWMPWVVCLDKYYKAREELKMDETYPCLMRWVDRLLARPAVARGMRVNGFDAPPELKNYSTAGSRSQQ